MLANIVGKPISQIFREFEGNLDPGQAHGSGDVKYHLGAEGKYFRMFGDGETTVSLASNPSHLEAVDPVLEGIVRAKQDLLDMGEAGYTVMPLMLHGDAAFAGQGVVAETLNLALLRGYRTGGTVHVVINNQVGFTTAPEASRTSQYCTDVAKMIGAPVFHVNGDDPEACVWVAKLAVEYRQRWHNDVVIDMLCYRRRGHNEGDDPSMTQPSMYDIIDAKRSVRKIYTESLIGRGDISVEEAEHALKDFSNQLEHVFREVREIEKAPPRSSESVERSSRADRSRHRHPARGRCTASATHTPSCPTGSPCTLGSSRCSPGGQDVARGRRRLGLRRAARPRITGAEGKLSACPVRTPGAARSPSGTRSLIDRVTGDEYVPLNHLADEQERFLPYDSALSEFAAVGFEYGYSVGNPDALVLWEAQFGDFANGAQSVIDEFISSGEAKWGQHCDVVLLLPHGLEGQGPDHSSGRIERFLQLCAEGSMTVALPSEPANYFHLLRRHALDRIRRPWWSSRPKSMLRNKAAVSPLSGLHRRPVPRSHRRPALPRERRPRRRRPPHPPVQRQDLLGAGRRPRRAPKNDPTATHAIVRIEQLYPLPHRQLAAVLERYPNATDVRWVQEEPANQGPWPYFGLELPEKLPERLAGLKRDLAPADGRPGAAEAVRSSCPATTLDASVGLGSSPTDASATIVDDSAGPWELIVAASRAWNASSTSPGVVDGQGVFDWQFSVSPLGQKFVRGNFGQFSDQGVPRRAGLTLGEDGRCLAGQGPSIRAILALGCWRAGRSPFGLHWRLAGTGLRWSWASGAGPVSGASRSSSPAMPTSVNNAYRRA